MAMSNHTGLIYYAFYNRDKIENEWPCLVGSSGGGGHIAAIEALRLYILNKAAEGKIKLAKPNLETYIPVNHAQKPLLSVQKGQIELGMGLPNSIKEVLKYLGLPILPNTDDIRAEIEKLANQNVNERSYIDMLLDVYPTGYESVAIWNVLQKQDKTGELKKLIDLQKQSDYLNYNYVLNYFTTLLEEAAKEKMPYTSLISSQAMALPALCDAVIYYNTKIANKHGALPIKIHQYLTDLPSPGAVHFLRSLERLSPMQRKVMAIYGVNLTKVKEFNLLGFAELVDIDPENNPMVRQGFYDPKLKEIAFNKNDIVLSIKVNKQPNAEHPIAQHEEIASIMLGSQASLDTISYVKEIDASSLYDKTFVFGGTLPHISKELVETAGYKNGRIVLLDNQADQQIAPIMTRSKLVIMRRGGLSIMEQMAMPHRPGQVILLHSKEDGHGKLSSGISWEDCNGDKLEESLEKCGVTVRQTTPELIKTQLEILQHADSAHLENDHNIGGRLFLRSKIIELQDKLKSYYSIKHGYEHSLSKSKNFLAILLLSKLNCYVDLLSDSNCELSDVAVKLAFVITDSQLENKKAYESTYFLKYFNDKGSLGNLLDEILHVVEQFCPLDYKTLRNPDLKRLTYL